MKLNFETVSVTGFQTPESLQKMKQIAKWTLPSPIYNWLVAKLKGTEYCPPVGHVNFGSLRRLTPISSNFGFDRGIPIVLYYTENFLASHSDDIKGRVLEIGDSFYTNKFGGDRVTKKDFFS